MCLLALAWQVHPKWPLVVVANRDERHDRPTAVLAHWTDAPIVAGRDLEAGGTWMGICSNQIGYWAALTNVREPERMRTGMASRGILVTDYLKMQVHPQVFLERHAANWMDYAGFNLMLRYEDQLWFLTNRGERAQWLEPGFYGLSNATLNTPWPKVQILKDALQSGLERVEEKWLDWLGDRQQAADAVLPNTGVGLELERLLSSAFIDNPRYGTRCSTLLLQGRDSWTIQEQSWNPQGQADVCIRLRSEPNGVCRR